MNRTTTAIVLALTATLAATAASLADDTFLATTASDYAAVGLAERGLSLGYDTSIAEMEARPVEAAGAYGSGGGGGHKNPMVALLLSCVVPGWGEIYAGETERGRWFMAAEASIWLGYGAFRLQESMRIDDYEEYARIHAGVTRTDSDYLADIGDFIRHEGDRSYNESIRADARSLYPDDLEAQAQYLAEHGYSDDEAWDWGTKARFLEYRRLREDAAMSDRRAFYMTGLAVLNRAMSAVDSAWMARRHNAGADGEPGARFSIAPEFSEGDVGARARFEVSF